MKRILTLRLLALICTVLLPLILPSEAWSQRNLVPLSCRDIKPSCEQFVFIEEGSVPLDSCWHYLFTLNDGHQDNRLLYSEYSFRFVFEGLREHAEEFDALSKGNRVLDSTNKHLIPEQGRTFVTRFAELYGFESIQASRVSADYNLEWDRPGNRFRYHFIIVNPGMYHLRTVTMIYAEAIGIDTTSESAIRESVHFDKLGMPQCLVPVSSIETVRTATPTPTPRIVSGGSIVLTEFSGPYMIADVNGQVVTQGILQPAESPASVNVGPGIYVLVAPTVRQLIFVLP